MKLGIVGLPNVGKSTLFNAMCKTGADVANYPFCTIDPNVGIVNVPDERLAPLVELYQSEKCVPAIVEFVDIAGLVAGASHGEGLGNQFLANIRETDAILQVVRCFEDENIVHVEGSTDPSRDIDTINTELILADLDYLKRRQTKLEKIAKSGDKQAKRELEILDALSQHMNEGQTARTFFKEQLNDGEELNDLSLLSAKPILFVANISEDQIGQEDSDPHIQAVRAAAEREGAGMVCVSARIESELSEMDPEEQAVFLEDLGLEESGLTRIIRESYKLLGLMSYLTAGPKEVKAWTIPIGTRAPQAAGKIHSDFERGFIRAEIVSFDDLIREGSMAKVKEKGLLRSEGKDYVMRDGDVVLFRFNV
ncbi:MAG: redox-regulated ATPase YchF [Eubacteriales bacterium]|nr:redox-regulated ATPase YchF [Eubacteriales bacterium]